MTTDATATLLARAFPDAPRVAQPAYLLWLYEASPMGRVVEANLDDEQGRAGHYAVVPLDLVSDGAPFVGALSLNTAVDERARRGGVFTRLAEATFEQAAARGVEVVVGVANANSTPGFVRRLGFELVTPLPATVLPPLPGPPRRVRSAWADEAHDLLRGAKAAIVRTPARGIATVWTEERLHWRLGAPGARYALHRGERALAVTTVDRRTAVPVAIVLAVFADARLGAADRHALVRAVCRFHRAPLALHIGVNDLVSFRGVPLPRRLRASPLNLIYRDLRGAARPGPVVRFELLDFDAY